MPVVSAIGARQVRSAATGFAVSERCWLSTGNHKAQSGAGETSASVLGSRTAGVRRALRADGSRSEVVLVGQCIAANSREHLPTPQNLSQRASSGRLEVAWKSLQKYRGRLEVTRLRG